MLIPPGQELIAHWSFRAVGSGVLRVKKSFKRILSMNHLELIKQRLVTCNLSLVTGDLQRSGVRVSQSPATSYQLPVTSLMGVSLRG